MPKIKPLTNRKKWKDDLIVELASAQVLSGKSYKQICRFANIRYETFMSHLRNIDMMREGEKHAFLEACEVLKGG